MGEFVNIFERILRVSFLEKFRVPSIFFYLQTLKNSISGISDSVRVIPLLTIEMCFAHCLTRLVCQCIFVPKNICSRWKKFLQNFFHGILFPCCSMFSVLFCRSLFVFSVVCVAQCLVFCSVDHCLFSVWFVLLNV